MMKGLTLRDKVNGFLIVLMGACGMFLFCLTSGGAEKGDTIGAIFVVGIIGGLSLTMVILSEVISVVRPVNNTLEDNQDGREGERVTGEIIPEISNFWLGITVILTLLHTALSAAYAIDPWDDWWYFW